MSRVNNTLLNTKINVLSYVVQFAFAMVSRKIFLQLLGNDFMGLNATIQNILGIINIAELGIWPATAFALYEYIYTDNRSKIQELLSLFGYLYKVVGLIVLAASIGIMFFIPLIFKNSHIELSLILVSFFVFLYSSLLSYFFNFQQILLIADQKAYVTVAITTIIQTVKIGVQILCLYLFHRNVYLWLLFEAIFATVTTIYLNVYVKKYFPWLKLPKYERAMLETNRGLFKNIKRLVSHKFAAIVISQTDNLLIYSFTSLSEVALFSNYTLIITKISFFLITISNGGYSSIGNLLASSDHNKIKKVFWELTSVRYIIAGVFVITCYYMTEPFIRIWLGSSYILDKWVLIILLFNTYVAITRMTVNNYIDNFGLFGHTWAPWTEAGLNLLFSFALGSRYGITGVLIGTGISLLLIVCVWQPFYLFRYKMKEDTFVNYWGNVFKYLGLLAAVAFIIHQIFSDSKMVEPTNWFSWILSAGLIAGLTGALYTILIYLTSSGLRDFLRRMSSAYNLKPMLLSKFIARKN